MKTIYLDNNATTKIAPEVIAAMLPVLTDDYGNPSSTHSFGGKLNCQIETAREKTANLLGVLPQEIIFTSCGTESNNTAIWSALQSNPEKKHIITTQVEHPAILNLCQYLTKHGYRITFVPVDQKGRLDLDFLFDHLSNDTALVSVMWANNESGVIFPMGEIAAKVKAKGITLHSDAVQALGKIPLDLGNTPVDSLSLSGHKIHAPKGIGALFVRQGTKFFPFLIGGGQENGRRAGTENTASIVGLGQACKLGQINLPKMETIIRPLRDFLEHELLKTIPHTFINGDPEKRLPNTLSISFKGLEGASILQTLNQYGICASAGSACNSNACQPSHVLCAMGLPLAIAHGTIRFSLSIYTRADEIDFIVEKLPSMITSLRKN